MTAAEGFILGVGAKMFTIAGPVIVYGMDHGKACVIRCVSFDFHIGAAGGSGGWGVASAAVYYIGWFFRVKESAKKPAKV